MSRRWSTRCSSAPSSTGERCSRRVSVTRSPLKGTVRSGPAVIFRTGPSSALPSASGAPPAQVLLRWCLQHELPAIAKSTHRQRIEENSRIFDLSLSNEDMADLDACDETGGTDRALERPWW